MLNMDSHLRESEFQARHADGEGVGKDATRPLARHAIGSVCYPVEETGAVTCCLLGDKPSARAVLELASGHEPGGKAIDIVIPPKKGQVAALPQ